MKNQKLLVIVALVCLMAFLNVSTFAQTAQAEPDPAKVMPKFVAQALKAAGYHVKRDGNKMTVEDKIVLEVPSTLQDWEDRGITASLVESEDQQGLSAESAYESQELQDLSPEDIAKFNQLRQCLGAADFVNTLKWTRCEFNVNTAADLLCKIRVLLGYLFDDLECIFTYLAE